MSAMLTSGERSVFETIVADQVATISRGWCRETSPRIFSAAPRLAAAALVDALAAGAEHPAGLRRALRDIGSIAASTVLDRIECGKVSVGAGRSLLFTLWSPELVLPHLVNKTADPACNDWRLFGQWAIQLGGIQGIRDLATLLDSEHPEIQARAAHLLSYGSLDQQRHALTDIPFEGLLKLITRCYDSRGVARTAFQHRTHLRTALCATYAGQHLLRLEAAIEAAPRWSALARDLSRIHARLAPRACTAQPSQ